MKKIILIMVLMFISLSSITLAADPQVTLEVVGPVQLGQNFDVNVYINTRSTDIQQFDLYPSSVDGFVTYISSVDGNWFSTGSILMNEAYGSGQIWGFVKEAQNPTLSEASSSNQLAFTLTAQATQADTIILDSASTLTNNIGYSLPFITVAAPVVISVTEICTSNFDEDGDGYIDCADADCASDAVCIDFDGDGYNTIADCDDTNLSINPGATEANTAECTDTFDNDCDGDIDLFDDQCFSVCSLSNLAACSEFDCITEPDAGWYDSVCHPHSLIDFNSHNGVDSVDTLFFVSKLNDEYMSSSAGDIDGSGTLDFNDIKMYISLYNSATN